MKRKKAEGVEVRVPIPSDGPLVFKFEIGEVDVRALAAGRCPRQVQETCAGMLDWLAGEDAPSSVPAGSSVGSRALFQEGK